MNGLIIKVLSISIAVVTVVYLIIYKAVSYTHLTLPTN